MHPSVKTWLTVKSKKVQSKLSILNGLGSYWGKIWIGIYYKCCFFLIQCPAGQLLKLLLPKYLQLWLLGEKYLNYASSLPHLLNYQMVLSFGITPTGISKIAGHPLTHNFDFAISMGEKEDTMLKLINILPRKSRIYFKLHMERNTESRGEDFVHVAQKFLPHFPRATFPLCNNVCV